MMRSVPPDLATHLVTFGDRLRSARRMGVHLVCDVQHLDVGLQKQLQRLIEELSQAMCKLDSTIHRIVGSRDQQLTRMICRVFYGQIVLSKKERAKLQALFEERLACTPNRTARNPVSGE